MNSVEHSFNSKLEQQCSVASGKYVNRTALSGFATCIQHMKNSWVLSFDLDLTITLACHLNVECYQLEIGYIKYYFRYFCKGHDRVAVELLGDSDRH